MKKLCIGALLAVSLWANSGTFAQDGKILSRTPFDYAPYLQRFTSENIRKGRFSKIDLRFLQNVQAERLEYLSDGLRVVGYLARPKTPGRYPCVIYNRGGNREFGAISPRKVVHILSRIASWGYVVVGSQYRGNDGGEGQEEFGGRDVNDVLNLIPLLANLPQADTSRIGMFGWSRGGMMTYLALARTDRIRAVVVGGGLSDLFLMKASRPEMEDVYRELIPDYEAQKEEALSERSAVRWPEKICKTTPVLMLHGTADWRVVPQMALDLAERFLAVKQPFRLVMFEGGDHGLSEFDAEVFRLAREWLDYYVRDRGPLPDLNPHGP